MLLKQSSVVVASLVLAVSAASQASAQGDFSRASRDTVAREIGRARASETERAPPADNQVYRRQRDQGGPAVGRDEIGPFEPIDPGWEIDSGVYEPSDFTIGGNRRSEVGLRWWNVGGPQTKVSRQINGGPWSVLQTFGALPANAYFDFVDTAPVRDAENCYRVSVSDGVNEFSAKATQVRCAFTRDDRNMRVHRLQLTLLVADIANADADDPIEVRLQPSSGYVTTVTNWIPAGNSTWLDSTADDFERGSSRTYDLMLNNVSQVSDITQITLTKDSGDDVCISGLSLLVDNATAHTQLFGQDDTDCVWVGGDKVYSVDFATLRASQQWTNLSPNTFVGFDGEELRSVIQAQFGHFLHGFGELRNSSLTSSRVDQNRLSVSVPITVYDAPILGDVDSRVNFDLVLQDGGRLVVENVDADSSDLLAYLMPVVGGAVLYGISVTIESQLEDLSAGGGGLGAAVPGTVPCFTQDGGISLCIDQG